MTFPYLPLSASTLVYGTGCLLDALAQALLAGGVFATTAMNPVPIPANLTMNQFMQLMQAQAPPLPGQGQQQAQQAPAAAGVAAMQPAYQQIHLPAGFSGPVFGFPNWVPAQQGIAGAQQQQQQPQWPMIPQVLGQPQVAPQQISMNDFTAALSAAVQSIQQDQASSGPPVGSNPGDEQTLVDALRKGRESGLDPRQILDKLHKVRKDPARLSVNASLSYRIGERTYTTR